MPAPNIIVAGATGYLGRRLLKHLPVERFAGVAVRRPSEDLPGVKFVIGMNSVEVPSPFAAAEDGVLIHLIGGGRGHRARDIYDMNVGVTEKLVTFARKTAVRRIIYMSGYGVGAESGSAYFQAKREAEDIIRASGLDFAILRCSYVLGGEDEFKPWLTASIAEKIVLLPGSGEYRIQPVYVDDLMRCLVALSEQEARHDAIYDFIGEPIAFSTFLTALLARLHTPTAVGETSVESLVRDTVVRADPIFSLDELAILLCDIVGPWTTDVAGVRPRPAAAVIEAIAREFEANAAPR